MKSRTRAAAAIAICALALSATAASAAPVTVTQNTQVVNGDNIVIGSYAAGTVVDMSHCAGAHCYVRGAGLEGWVPQGVVVGAAAPAPAPPPPAPPAQQPVPRFNFELGIGTPAPGRRPRTDFEDDEDELAQICFYDQANFRGRSFCVEEGDSDDALPRNWNDRISSVEVSGDLTVEVCRNTGMNGTCATINRDIRRLPSSLNDRISSYEVY